MSEDSKDSGILGVAGGVAGAAGAGYLANNHLGDKNYLNAIRHENGTLEGMDKLDKKVTDRYAKIATDTDEHITKANNELAEKVTKKVKAAGLDLSPEKLAEMNEEQRKAQTQKINDIIREEAGKPLQSLNSAAARAEKFGEIKAGSFEKATFIKGENGLYTAKLIGADGNVAHEIAGIKHVPEEVGVALKSGATGAEHTVTDVSKFLEKDNFIAKNLAHAEQEAASAGRKIMGAGNTFKHLGTGGKAAVVGAAVVGGVGVKMAFDALFGSKKEGGYAAKIEAERSQAASAEPARA